MPGVTQPQPGHTRVLMNAQYKEEKKVRLAKQQHMQKEDEERMADLMVGSCWSACQEVGIWEGFPARPDSGRGSAGEPESG